MEEMLELTLDTLLDVLGSHAKHVLIDMGISTLMPLYHIHGDEDLAIGCPWENTDQKLESIKEVKRRAAKLNATMIGFVGEVWMSKHGPGVDLETVPLPSQSPDRQEAVLATVTDGETTKTKAWEIIRNTLTGTILFLSPMMKEEGTVMMMFNRMVEDMLPKQRRRTVN